MKKKVGPGQPAKTKSRLEQLEEEMTSSTTGTEEEDIINSKRKGTKSKTKAATLKKNHDVSEPKSRKDKKKGSSNKGNGKTNESGKNAEKK